MWDILYDYVLPTVLSLLSLIVTVALPPIVFKWLEGRGIVIEKDRQVIFQQGLDNAAKLVVSRAQGGPITRELLETGARYVEQAVPDQVKHWKLSTEDLLPKVEAKVDAFQHVTTIAQGLAPIIPYGAPALAAVEAAGNLVQIVRRISGKARV